MAENGKGARQEFDAMQYFTVLTSLSLPDGHVLDYVYELRCCPILYVRKNTEERYATLSDFPATKGKARWLTVTYEYLNCFHIEDTRQGYFQFALLRLLGGQFYLFDHALYFDTIVICSEDALYRVLEMDIFGKRKLPEGVIQEAKEIDPAPQIIMEDGWATVKLVTFSKWGGFKRAHMRIRRNFPHEIDFRESEQLVGYDCGLRF